jgi:hypothetical protein
LSSTPESSTPERSRGQVLAFFSFGFATILMMAALALDVGMMTFEIRQQQDAADAAAIAASRYVVIDADLAISTAIDLATANGFTDGVNSQTVSVSIPPTSGAFEGRAYYVEVEISSTRPSLLGSLMNITEWEVGARAVATNQDTVNAEWAIISLHPTLCDAAVVAGNGSVIAYGNIQVNSNCDNGALRRQGAGNISVLIPGGACNVVGDIQDGGGQGIFDCVQNEGAPELPDPLASLTPPAVPPLPLPMQRLAGTLPTPTGCPGSTDPATVADPHECRFESNYAADGAVWRMYPGHYPGGIKFMGGVFYLEPGIYYLGGGGLVATGNGTTLVSVLPGGTTGPSGGVMFYNSEIAGSAIEKIFLNGAQADINLVPIKDGSQYENLLLWQDRDYDINGDDITINGSDSDMSVRGLIYVPVGDIKVNGGSGILRMDTTIGSTYQVHGSNGSLIQILDEDQYRFSLLAAGLVE